MRNFRTWDVWKNSKALVKEIYLMTANFPDSEKYGLVSQLRRAAVSIPTNIAEGAGRRTERDFRGFLFVATGSSFEVETLLDLSLDLEFITQEHYNTSIHSLNIVQKQLNSFISRLNTENNQ